VSTSKRPSIPSTRGVDAVSLLFAGGRHRSVETVKDDTEFTTASIFRIAKSAQVSFKSANTIFKFPLENLAHCKSYNGQRTPLIRAQKFIHYINLGAIVFGNQ
jgi:hypothetical protein